MWRRAYALAEPDRWRCCWPSPARAQVLNYDAVFEQPTLTGNWGGARTRLEDQGIQLGGDEIAETLGNPEGGPRQGWVGEGRFEVFANLDLGKLLDWHGAIFHANAYQIHGAGLTSHYLGNLVTVSNIEVAARHAPVRSVGAAIADGRCAVLAGGPACRR